MKKLVIALVAILVLALPAFAYEVTYIDGFESGGLAQWTAGSWGTCTVGTVAGGYQVRTGTYAFAQGTSTTDYKVRQFAPYLAKAGQIDAWVYDEMVFPPAGGATFDDMRVGAVSSKCTAFTATNSAAGYIVGAVTNTSGGSWGSSVYYCYQWSYTQGRMDGYTLPSYANTTFTMSTSPALRSLGWHRWRVKWSFDYSLGTGQIQWYVDSTLAPKLTMLFGSSNARWANTSDVKYGILGNWSAVAHGRTYVDDYSFAGDFVPEPASLMVLGTGLVGLAGLIRRRR